MRKLDINKLDIAQKIGQVIMPRIDFNDPDSLPLAKRLVKECEVGGFIIFNGNRDIVTTATRELQAVSEIPLLFGCDAERGLGQIVSDATLFPFTMSLGAVDDEELVYNQAGFIAREMKECGLNLLFAPVADVNTNPDNPIINIRSYGDEYDLVSRLCVAFIKGCQEGGVLACAKHFPGHGRTGVDSHVDLPVIRISKKILLNSDLIPFEKSIEAGVASIMTAHIAFPEIGDGNAVTISKGLVSDLLRNEMGYQGLIITDSLHMEGISKLGKQGGLSRRALNAGCDIILDPKDPYTLIQNLSKSSYQELDESRLNPSVERIISIKNKWLTRDTSIGSKIKEQGIDLRERIARRSLCIVKGGVLKSRKAVVYTFDVTQSNADISSAFNEHLEKAGVRLEKRSNSLNDSLNKKEPITDNLSDETAIICLLYTSIGAWKKQSFLPDSFKDVLTGLESIHRETVLISFGSPYVVRDFDNFKTVICSFDSLSECQRAAADVLLGKVEAQGRLPVSLNLN